MTMIRVTMEAELEVSEEAESNGITAHAFAHHLKDSQVWAAPFETLPTGEATPGALTVLKIEEVDEDGDIIDTWIHPDRSDALRLFDGDADEEPGDEDDPPPMPHGQD